MIITTDRRSYEVQAEYDGEEGGWTTKATANGDFMTGSGGSLELAVYSLSQAIKAYEEWGDKAEQDTILNNDQFHKDIDEVTAYVREDWVGWSSTHPADAAAKRIRMRLGFEDPPNDLEKG